jgi:hypothetical protein
VLFCSQASRGCTIRCRAAGAVRQTVGPSVGPSLRDGWMDGWMQSLSKEVKVQSQPGRPGLDLVGLHGI